MTGADLIKLYADGERVFDRADLQGADLRGADLQWADLRGADLQGAKLQKANLRGTDLRWADLRGANLQGANLQWAYLRWADLQKADLQGAKVHNIRWPSPAMVLLAEWGQLSDDLTLDLMRLDAWGHPDPKAFDHWVEGGPCPYDGVDVQRVASFKERKGCWSPGPPKKLYTLMRRVLEECCDYGEGE